MLFRSETNTTSRKFIIEEIIIDDARKINESIVQTMVLEEGNILSKDTSMVLDKTSFILKNSQKTPNELK